MTEKDMIGYMMSTKRQRQRLASEIDGGEIGKALAENLGSSQLDALRRGFGSMLIDTKDFDAYFLLDRIRDSGKGDRDGFASTCAILLHYDEDRYWLSKLAALEQDGLVEGIDSSGMRHYKITDKGTEKLGSDWGRLRAREANDISDMQRAYRLEIKAAKKKMIRNV